jgi:hypothetical protein
MKMVYILSTALALSLTTAACSSPRKFPSKNNVKDYINNQISSEQGESASASSSSSVDSPLANHATGEAVVVDNSTQEAKAEENSKAAAEPSENSSANSTNNGDGKVDYDLTQMSPDMVYASVYQMMVEPEKFEGKTFKMIGTYYSTWYEPTARNYHYVIIEDAAACCAQGIEFVWGDGSHVFPDEYPKGNVRLEVTGTFRTYKEEGDDRLYCRLENSDIREIS